MSLYALKPRFQALLRPRVTRLAERGTTANQVTLAAAAGLVVEAAAASVASEEVPEVAEVPVVAGKA